MEVGSAVVVAAAAVQVTYSLHPGLLAQNVTVGADWAVPSG
mgnify:CR=1 FL=1